MDPNVIVPNVLPAAQANPDIPAPAAAAAVPAGAQAAAAMPDIHLARTNAKLLTFKGDLKLDPETPRDWLNKFIAAKNAAHWNDADALSNVSLLLAKEAKTWFDTLKVRHDYQHTFAYFEENFTDVFIPEITQKGTQKKTENVKQKPNERIQLFYARILSYSEDYKAAMPKMTINRLGLAEGLNAEMEQHCINFAVAQCTRLTRHWMDLRNLAILQNGLLPHYAKHLNTQNFNNDVELAVRLLSDYEKNLMSQGEMKTPSQLIEEIQEEQSAKQDEPQQKEKDIDEDKIEALFQKFTMKNSNQNRNYQNNRNNSNNSNNSNNYQRNNQNNQQNNQSNNGQNNRRFDTSKMKCLYCQKVGHAQVQCNLRKQRNMPCIGKDNKPYWPPGEKNPFINQNQNQDFQK